VSIAVIINPISGVRRADEARPRVRLATDVAASLRTPVDVVVTEGAGHARELARAAVAAGARLIIAWGGDGTINEVASALAFGPVPLGIVPAGSGNGLARELGVSRRPAQAIASALTAAPRAMDVGEIEGRLFVNIAGVGLDAHIAAQFDAPGRRRGFLGYVGITARALRRYVPLRYRITTGAEHVDVCAMLVTIANSPQFGNGACIAPGARVDDGVLDLVTIEEQSRLATMCALPRLFTGSVDRLRGCRIRQVREVAIESDRPLTFHVDGEPVHGGPTLHARVHAGALRVCV